MKKSVKESLFEDKHQIFKSNFNIENEMNFFSDIKSAYKEHPDTMKKIINAISEFGANEKDIGVLASFGTSIEWQSIKDELDKHQFEYYEFNTDDGESIILFKLNDLESEKNEKPYKLQRAESNFF